MLTEQTFVDKIEVVTQYRVVQVRLATVVYRDGAEITRTFERYTIQPGQDYSNEEEFVQRVCEAAHTPEVIASFANYTGSSVE